MKILYIITTLTLGGAETQICNLCDEFSKLGHDVNVIYLYGEKIISPKNEAIPIYSIGLTKSPLSAPTAFYRLVKLIRKIKPDVVHSHMVHANLITRLARLFCNIPVLISTAHNINEGGKLRMLAYRYTDKLADLSTNVSQRAVDAFIFEKRASFEGRMIMVPNGININHFTLDYEKKFVLRKHFGFKPNEKILIAVARNAPEKDYNNLLNAIQLIPSNIEFKFIVVGLNTELLLNDAKKLGIDHRITFLGLRKDVSDLLMLADIFVLSSKYEGFPIVIGEAMACECGVVTTDAGGAAEWLTNKDYVVPIKSPKKLAKKLIDMLSITDEELTRLGKQNRRIIIENFSLESVVRKWFHIYTEYLKINKNQ